MLTVSDDGQGGDNGEVRAGYGIGLVNVRERLGARFGDEATIVSGPVPGGYSTQLRIPILHEAEEGA